MPAGRPAGSSGGSSTLTLATDNLPPHSHIVAPLASKASPTAISPAGKVPAAKPGTALYAEPAWGNAPMAASATSSTGGGVPIEAMPRYLVFTCGILAYPVE